MGLKVNYSKTSVHCLGNCVPYVSEQQIVWDPGGLDILGISVAVDSDVQYQNALAKASGILDKWKWHKLTIMGKVIIVKHADCLTVCLFHAGIARSKSLFFSRI